MRSWGSECPSTCLFSLTHILEIQKIIELFIQHRTRQKPSEPWCSNAKRRSSCRKKPKPHHRANYPNTQAPCPNKGRHLPRQYAHCTTFIANQIFGGDARCACVFLQLIAGWMEGNHCVSRPIRIPSKCRFE